MGKDVYRGISGKLIIILMSIVHCNVHRWITKYMDIQEDDEILDIGCGSGNLLKIISKETINKACGIDYSDSMIIASEKKNKKSILSGKIEVIKASVTKIPYDNDTFDKITAFETIQFWPDIVNDLKEVRRVLKEEGKLYIMNRLPKENSKWYDFSQLKTPDNYKIVLEEAGFTNINIDIISKKKWIYIVAS